MNKQICKYSIIRFQPYPETEEFANIGIVLYATASKCLEFRLLDGKYGRITDFFKPLDRDVFLQTSKIICAEMQRIKEFLALTEGVDIDLFGELIRRREDIIRFSENRVLFSNDPVATIEKLFEHYVHRSFTQEPSYEEKIRRKVRELLDHYNIGDRYKERFIGETEKYGVKFPFVSVTAKQAIIKPIHFKHDKPSQLIDHGLEWLVKIKQLEKYGFVKPDNILFAYDAPNENQGNLSDAFFEVKEQIEQGGILMSDINDKDNIVKFAD